MRYFFGTTIDVRQADVIHHDSRLVIGQGKWRQAPMEQWHVTSLFVGEREDPSILGSAGAKYAAAFAPIQLLQGRLVTMPKEDPVMLWVRFTPNEELTALHMALANATGTPPSVHRPYWPHITLARSRGKVEPLRGSVVVASMTLTQLSLFRSTPSPKGTIHEAIRSWPFTGKGPVDRAEEF